MSGPESITPQQAAHSPEALVLDVREIDEWLAGHAPAAVHVPLMDLPRRLDGLPRDRPILCICRSGNRSGQAAAFLIGQGFDAHNVVGGMKAWAADGLPVERVDGGAGAVI